MGNQQTIVSELASTTRAHVVQMRWCTFGGGGQRTVIYGAEMDQIEEFVSAVNAPDAGLDRLAVLLARCFGSTSTWAECDANLAELAERASGVVDAQGNESGLALSRFFSDVAGFGGNIGDYYDPANSFIDTVLNRRLGIPISLSLVFQSVAARLGLAVDIIGFPGNVLVGGAATQPWFYDPFGGNFMVGVDTVAAWHRATHGQSSPFHRGYLAPMNRVQTLDRMLNNLKEIYVTRSDLDRLVTVATLRARLPRATGDSGRFLDMVEAALRARLN